MIERFGWRRIGPGLLNGHVVSVAGGGHHGFASAAISGGVRTPWYMWTSSMVPETKSTKAELCLPRPTTV